MTLILGLESSCDDSAAALVTADRRILAQAVVGQNSAHQPYGGVVPEIAARAHVEILPGLIRKVLGEAGLQVGVFRLTTPAGQVSIEIISFSPVTGGRLNLAGTWAV